MQLQFASVVFAVKSVPGVNPAFKVQNSDVCWARETLRSGRGAKSNIGQALQLRSNSLEAQVQST